MSYSFKLFISHIMRDVAKFLEGRCDASASNESLSELWRELRDLHARKLWHQLTSVLVKLVHRPELQGDGQLLQLYTEAIEDFENRLNSLTLVELCRPIVASISDPKEAFAFSEKLGEKVKRNKEAFALTKILCGQIQLKNFNDDVAVKKTLAEVEELLNEVEGVGLVQREFYLLSSDFYKKLGQHANFYQACLRYLGVSNLSERSDEDNHSLALHLSLAALLGKNVFNFGELLAHPILKFLEKSSDDWLVELLRAFNSGNVSKFKSMKGQWSAQADLKANEEVLYEKVCLLALMEMTFQRSATDRQLTFNEIANQTGLSNEKIEFLVMKALSRGLIKGQIDQVSGSIHVSWVQPRVLDCDQLVTLQTKIENWVKSIGSMEQMIETNAAEILTQ